MSTPTVLRKIAPLPLLLFLAACNPNRNGLDNTGAFPGYVPVYMSATAASAVSAGPAQPTLNAGKIYAYGSFLFQVEAAKGIHIIDNSIPRAAKKIGFLSVPLASEIAIKADHLYTNNVDDLVVFSLANPAAPQLVKRVPDAFPIVEQMHPPFTGVYFDCPDASKGVVVAWEQKQLTNPKCRR